jgi:hypothetical protein
MSNRVPDTYQAGNDSWLQHLFNFDSVEHLIKDGKFLSLYYDFEATDLNPMFAAPTQFCGKIVDVQGRILDTLKMDIQVPEDVVVSPQAAIVTQSDPTKLYQQEGRMPPHLAAARITLFFRNPYRALWDQLADHSMFLPDAPGKEKEVRVYTVKSHDGSKEASIRLHQGGKFISIPYADEARLPDGANTYRDADGTRWKRFPAPAITKGHNIRRYDDRLLWSFLHRYMSDELFITHTKKFQRFRVDTLDLAKMVALLDDGGENGFKPGTKISKATNQPYQAFTLSSLMKANTREPIPERGLDEGVRMPDGSQYDEGYAHADAEYDVDATIALNTYLRKRSPEILRIMETNADFERIKPFLIGGEGFEMHPLRCFARDIFPHGAQLHMGVCVNINEEIEERRQAVMIRTDLDQPLASYQFRGKKLLDMSVDELAIMMEAQQGKPDALCEVINLRKNPRVLPAELAFRHGKGGNPDTNEANRRFVLAHEDLCQKLMQAHSKTVPPMPDYRSIRNPQAEEHLFTGIASPKRYEFEMDAKTVLLAEDVHAEWVKALRRTRAIDALLRRALKPQTVEIENREDTLLAFCERMKTVDQHLQKYLSADVAPSYDRIEENKGNAGRHDFKVLPPPNHAFMPPKWDEVKDPESPGKTKRVHHEMSAAECAQLTQNAVEYLWQLRTELMHEFHDNTTRFTVQDRYGHDIPFTELNRMKQGDRADRLRTGEYVLHLEQLNWSAELVARMFRDAGRLDWVKHYWAERGRTDKVEEWRQWEDYFVAHRAHRIHGAPHEDNDAKRWMTAPKALKETTRITNNLRQGDVRAMEDEWGEWDSFMPEHHTAEPILRASEQLSQRLMDANPFTPAQRERMGYHVETGFPIEHTPYEIPRDANMITINVPDHMLERPLQHHHVAQKIVMLNPDAQQRRALDEAGPDTYLFLRGAQTGRTYLAAKPILLSSERIAPTPYFNEVYAAAANRYEDSGMAVPEASKLVPLAVEDLAPVPAAIDSSIQAVKIKRWEDFMATVSPALGYRDAPLTGMVIQDYGYTPKVGAARLQGMCLDAHKPGLVESGWEVASHITRTYSLNLEEVIERIKAGREQMKSAVALGFPSIEVLRDAVSSQRVSHEQVEAAGLKNLKQLGKLVAKPCFTPQDAEHYGFTNLSDMKSKLTAMFIDKERAVGQANNTLHFIDLAPNEQAHMVWHRPGRVAKVRMVEPPSPEALPDPTRVAGGPQITRGHESSRQRSA